MKRSGRNHASARKGQDRLRVDGRATGTRHSMGDQLDRDTRRERFRQGEDNEMSAKRHATTGPVIEIGNKSDIDWRRFDMEQFA